MAIYTKLNKAEIRKLLEHFPEIPRTDFKSQGIALGTVNTYYKLTFSKNQVYYLKIDEVGNLTRLQDEIRVFDFLDQRRKNLKLDVPVPLNADNQRKFIPFHNKFVLVIPEIKGISYYHRDLTPSRMKTIGTTLARWHKICKNPKLPSHRFDLAGQQKVFRQIREELISRHPQIEKFITKKLREFATATLNNEKLTLIHADLFAENLLWIGKHLNGIVDFDAAGKGSPLFDVGVVLHALCHDGKNFYPEKIRGFLTGYFGKSSVPKHLQKAFRYYLELSAMRFLLTRLRDVELNPKGRKAKPFKDYREFVRRFGEIESLITS